MIPFALMKIPTLLLLTSVLSCSSAGLSVDDIVWPVTFNNTRYLLKSTVSSNSIIRNGSILPKQFIHELWLANTNSPRLIWKWHSFQINYSSSEGFKLLYAHTLYPTNGFVIAFKNPSFTFIEYLPYVTEDFRPLKPEHQLRFMNADALGIVITNVVIASSREGVAEALLQRNRSAAGFPIQELWQWNGQQWTRIEPVNDEGSKKK